MDVFNALGKMVLDNAWEGYHCCLFAYGQTGSGKSFSMVGYGKNKGIVPISMNEIFERVKAQQSETKSFEVCASIIEIYNEKVQDLLIDPRTRPAGGLKVRESKTLGVYVQDMTKHPVTSYAQIEKLMDEGYENRSVGSTQMNATSSRAHTIITIEIKQVIFEGGRKLEKFSVINLVDLAGSEKAGQTGATGDRLKEGCAINKSLTVLGQCISTLADKAIGKAQGTVVPYRDSALTRILQNALGGNSKTIMVCALSPASINYEETLSTLRYAERAKKIKNQAIINESPQEKMIRELRVENDKLKKILKNAMKGGGVINLNELDFDIGDMMETMEENDKAIEEMEKPFEQKIAEAQEKREMAKTELVKLSKGNNKDKRLPHLTNLLEIEDQSFFAYYGLFNCPVYVGRKNGDPKPEIILEGSAIKPNHAVFELNLETGNISIKAANEEAGRKVKVNGESLEGRERILHHMDRILFGFNTIFIFRYPLMKRKLEKLMRGRILQETAGIQDMEKDEAMNLLLLKAEEVVDNEGIYVENDYVVSVEIDEDDEEDDDERRNNEYGKLMSETYDADEQQQDIELYKIDWDKAHKEAFGDIDIDAINNNVANVDTDKIMIEQEDLDDRLKEQESQYIERQRMMETEYLEQME